MRIAQVSTLASPVRGTAAESVETLVWLLTRELTRLGHDVTVFASAGSAVDGRLVSTLPASYGLPGAFGDWQLCEWVNLVEAIRRAGEFDVLHSHAYLWGIPLQALGRVPMVHTMHVMPNDDSALLRRRYPDAVVTALSAFQWSEFPDLPPAAIVPHGIDPGQFTFAAQPDDYVCYLGRFIPGKGPLAAIETARALGLPIRLAGPDNDYFATTIAPLVDGRTVQHVGLVSGDERSRFLGGARVLLYPLEEPEPFGLVPIEAMMCGTPVAAMCLGAVPEIVDPGVTGEWATERTDFTRAVATAMRLDRRRVRQQAEARFSYTTMARGYLSVYEQVASRRRRSS